MTNPEALTAEEEAELRRDLDFGGAPSSVPALWLRVRRLLATLDAARAARPETGLDWNTALDRAMHAVGDLQAVYPVPGQHDGFLFRSDVLNALLGVRLATPPADAPLDVAWRAAEAALPEGWRLAVQRDDERFNAWHATAVSPAFFDGAEALLALAARLTDGDG